MSNQRAGKTHSASLQDGDKIRLTDLVNFCKSARTDLEREGDSDAALRFEILEDWLRNDFRGSFKYDSKMIGL
jgi:hypothetical protein